MRYYLYRHVRLDKNSVFYVGIGTKNYNDIKYGGYARAISKYGRNNHWVNITNKTKYKIDILYESSSKKTIIQKEIEFIKLYGRADCGGGTLVNMTDGGDGTGRKNKYLFKTVLVFNKALLLLYEANNSKNASVYIYGNKSKHKQIAINCKYGFLTKKQYYVIYKEDYENNNINFKLVRKKVKPSRNNCKSFYYNDKFYETKGEFKRELSISRKKFNDLFKEMLTKEKIKWK